VKKERKKDRGRSANDNVDGDKQNEANKAQSEKNNNQPDRNGGNLPSAGGRQLLNTAMEHPILLWSIFEEAEVVKNRKVSFGIRVDARD
jgi:hypothetical protein